eukprot:gb/GECG01010782.1/.p1 GENE.gb/GECG01010782.1/~~gb/GECG01010782.1/.p1  ORF type:complete len:1331 (+),score=169.26 gb/GECG01010782.1/:1-3993(+)
MQKDNQNEVIELVSSSEEEDEVEICSSTGPLTDVAGKDGITSSESNACIQDEVNQLHDHDVPPTSTEESSCTFDTAQATKTTDRVFNTGNGEAIDDTTPRSEIRSGGNYGETTQATSTGIANTNGAAKRNRLKDAPMAEGEKGNERAVAGTDKSPQRKRTRKGGFLRSAKQEDLADAKSLQLSTNVWNRDSWLSDSESTSSSEEGELFDTLSATTSGMIISDHVKSSSSTSRGLQITPTANMTTTTSDSDTSSKGSRGPLNPRTTKNVPKDKLDPSLEQVLKPYLISRGETALKTSVLPFINRALSMPVPWILDPQFKVCSSTDYGIFNFLMHSIQTFDRLPRKREHFLTAEEYIAHHILLLLEEVRAQFCTGIEWWQRKLKCSSLDSNKLSILSEVDMDKCSYGEVKDVSFSNGGFKTATLLLDDRAAYDRAVQSSVLDQNDIVLAFSTTSVEYHSFLALVQLPQTTDESPFSKSIHRSSEDNLPRLVVSPFSDVPKYSRSDCEQWVRQASQAISKIQQGQFYYVLKLGNLVTPLREYNAIRIAPRTMFYPLLTCNQRMVKCELSTTTSRRNQRFYLPLELSKPANLPYALYDRLKRSFNSSQLAAVLYSIRQSVKVYPQDRSSASTRGTAIVAGATLAANRGRPREQIQDVGSTDWGTHGVSEKPPNSAFNLIKNQGVDVVLIEGPPGTGKTSTIMGIISAILACKSTTSARSTAFTLDSGSKMGMSRGSCNAGVIVGEKEHHRNASSFKIQNGSIPGTFKSVPKKPASNRPATSNIKTVRTSSSSDSSSSSGTTNVNRIEGSSTEAVSSLQRVLVCSPSNTAVDEIVRRLRIQSPTGSDGRFRPLWSSTGDRYQPRIVRVGPTNVIDSTVQDLSLDNQVEASVKSQAYEILSPQEFQSHHDELQNIERELQKFPPKEIGIDNQQMEEERAKLEDRKKILGNQLKTSKAGIAQKKEHRNRSRQRILEEAHIIATTLACSNSHDIQSLGGRGFDAVIVDESCQSVEPTSLIPFAFFCRKIILIGDPQQLPPTTLSRYSTETGYNRSLFERLSASGVPICMLTEQYRMIPSLRSFPSKHFYGNALTDSRTVLDRKQMPFHRDPCFNGLIWLDINPNQSFMKKLPQRLRNSLCIVDNSSFANPLEAEIVVALYEHLLRASFRKDEPKENRIDMRGRVGVITPYRGQIRMITRTLDRVMGPDVASGVSVNTVDGFQGQEKDVIIISCVRSTRKRRSNFYSDTDDTDTDYRNGIGFLKDARRMNVALTRGRHTVVIVGDASCLSKYSPDWQALVTHCKKQGSFLPTLPDNGSCCAGLQALLKERRYQVAASVF